MPTAFPDDHVEPYPAQFIRIDLFPANAVFTPTEGEPIEYGSARVILTDGNGYVYADTPTGPRAVLVGALTGFEGSNKTGYIGTFDDGQLSFARSNGCGCGSRLRGINPLPSTPHEALSIF